jgi:hypothetical protein
MIVQRCRDLVAEIGNFPGLTVKRQGIYIIMYKNPRIYLQNRGKGLCARGGVSPGGYEQDSLVTV